MIYFSLAIGIILIMFLSFATNGLWVKYINNKFLKGFLLPGAIVHELSHALLCLITGTTISELNLFRTDNTGIKYDKPKVPFVFDFIITSAPLFGCAFFILFISGILSNPIRVNNAFPEEILLSFNGLFNLIRYLLDSVWITFHSFRSQFRIEEVRHVLFLFAIIVFTVSMSPHKQDFKYLIPGFAILFAILFFLEKFGVSLLKNSWWSYFIKELWTITTLSISVLATLLFFTLIIMGFIKGYRLTFGQKGSNK
ncbi:MAG: hypothetical protein A2W17_07445 [Planctomycetes bacterium RBG_16_41_13]|nr:MAG: hypothetical protein A2W17_07445 [Planctomycetes bacterium RBG_16_41_13]